MAVFVVLIVGIQKNKNTCTASQMGSIQHSFIKIAILDSDQPYSGLRALIERGEAEEAIEMLGTIVEKLDIDTREMLRDKADDLVGSVPRVKALQDKVASLKRDIVKTQHSNTVTAEANISKSERMMENHEKDLQLHQGMLSSARLREITDTVARAKAALLESGDRTSRGHRRQASTLSGGSTPVPRQALTFDPHRFEACIALLDRVNIDSPELDDFQSGQQLRDTVIGLRDRMNQCCTDELKRWLMDVREKSEAIGETVLASTLQSMAATCTRRARRRQLGETDNVQTEAEYLKSLYQDDSAPSQPLATVDVAKLAALRETTRLLKTDTQFLELYTSSRHHHAETDLASFSFGTGAPLHRVIGYYAVEQATRTLPHIALEDWGADAVRTVAEAVSAVGMGAGSADDLIAVKDRALGFCRVVESITTTGPVLTAVQGLRSMFEDRLLSTTRREETQLVTPTMAEQRQGVTNPDDAARSIELNLMQPPVPRLPVALQCSAALWTRLDLVSHFMDRLSLWYRHLPEAEGLAAVTRLVGALCLDPWDRLAKSSVTPTNTNTLVQAMLDALSLQQVLPAIIKKAQMSGVTTATTADDLSQVLAAVLNNLINVIASLYRGHLQLFISDVRNSRDGFALSPPKGGSDGPPQWAENLSTSLLRCLAEFTSFPFPLQAQLYNVIFGAVAGELLDIWSTMTGFNYHMVASIRQALIKFKWTMDKHIEYMGRPQGISREMVLEQLLDAQVHLVTPWGVLNQLCDLFDEPDIMVYANSVTRKVRYGSLDPTLVQRIMEGYRPGSAGPKKKAVHDLLKKLRSG